jgi:hypothetical protein
MSHSQAKVIVRASAVVTAAISLWALVFLAGVISQIVIHAGEMAVSKTYLETRELQVLTTP